jgi:hypothetical protein
MRVEKIDVFPAMADIRRGTKRGGSVSITLGGSMLAKAGLDGLTDFAIIPVDGVGLLIRPAPLPGAGDFKQEPAEHARPLPVATEDEGLF